MPINKGWYNNLWAELEIAGRVFHLEVRLVTRFHFRPDLSLRPPDPAPRDFRPWTAEEKEEWKSNFIELIEERWSRRHRLYGDISPAPVDISRLTRDPDFATADVDLKVIDIDDPPEGITVPSRQVHHQIHVWREQRGIAHASARTRVAALAENAMESLTGDSGRAQTAALHEVGHLLGLVHSGCPQQDQMSYTDSVVMNSPQCYGRDSGQMDSVMGQGDTIRARDYLVFAFIMEQLQPDRTWYAGPVQAEYPGGGRVAAFQRGLISPTQSAVGPLPGVQTRGAIYPSLQAREGRAVA